MRRRQEAKWPRSRQRAAGARQAAVCNATGQTSEPVYLAGKLAHASHTVSLKRNGEPGRSGSRCASEKPLAVARMSQLSQIYWLGGLTGRVAHCLEVHALSGSAAVLLPSKIEYFERANARAIHVRACILFRFCLLYICTFIPSTYSKSGTSAISAPLRLSRDHGEETFQPYETLHSLFIASINSSSTRQDHPRPLDQQSHLRRRGLLCCTAALRTCR